MYCYCHYNHTWQHTPLSINNIWNKYFYASWFLTFLWYFIIFSKPLINSLHHDILSSTFLSNDRWNSRVHVFYHCNIFVSTVTHISHTGTFLECFYISEPLQQQPQIREKTISYTGVHVYLAFIFYVKCFRWTQFNSHELDSQGLVCLRLSICQTMLSRSQPL